MVSFRRMVVFIAFAGLMVGLSSIADASQHGRPQPGQREITGRVGAPEMVLRGPVVSVEPNAGFLVVRLGTGPAMEEIPVEVDTRTSVTRAGKRVGLNEVRPGDRALIRYSGQPGAASKTVEVTRGR